MFSKKSKHSSIAEVVVDFLQQKKIEHEVTKSDNTEQRYSYRFNFEMDGLEYTTIIECREKQERLDWYVYPDIAVPEKRVVDLVMCLNKVNNIVLAGRFSCISNVHPDGDAIQWLAGLDLTDSVLSLSQVESLYDASVVLYSDFQELFSTVAAIDVGWKEAWDDFERQTGRAANLDGAEVPPAV